MIVSSARMVTSFQKLVGTFLKQYLCNAVERRFLNFKFAQYNIFLKRKCKCRIIIQVQKQKKIKSSNSIINSHAAKCAMPPQSRSLQHHRCPTWHTHVTRTTDFRVALSLPIYSNYYKISFSQPRNSKHTTMLFA